MRLAAIVFGICVCLALEAQAQAQAPAQTQSDGAARPSAEDLAAGREHFKRAGEHYRAGRYRQALQSLRLSDASVPSPELWFNMGKAHEQLGEVEAAIEQYERYIEARADAPDAPKVRARVAALEAALDQRPKAARAHAALRIDAAEAGVAVRLDGESLGTTPIDSLIRVEPGSHVLEAERQGHAPFRAEIAAPAGAMVIGSIETVRLSSAPALEHDGARGAQALSPASARRASASPAVGAPVWISGGAAVASLVASAAARGVGEAQRSDGDLEAARGAGTVADVTLASALASSAVAAILYFVTSDTERAEEPLR